MKTFMRFFRSVAYIQNLVEGGERSGHVSAHNDFLFQPGMLIWPESYILVDVYLVTRALSISLLDTSISTVTARAIAAVVYFRTAWRQVLGPTKDSQKRQQSRRRSPRQGGGLRDRRDVLW